MTETKILAGWNEGLVAVEADTFVKGLSPIHRLLGFKAETRFDTRHLRSYYVTRITYCKQASTITTP